MSVRPGEIFPFRSLEDIAQNDSAFILPLKRREESFADTLLSEGVGNVGGGEDGPGVEGGQIDTSQTKHLFLSKVLCVDSAGRSLIHGCQALRACQETYWP